MTKLLPDENQRTCENLAAYGNSVVDLLAKVLDDRTEEVQARHKFRLF